MSSNPRNYRMEGTFIEKGDDLALALAYLFCSLTADRQAAFLHHVEVISSEWKSPAVSQWSEMERDMTPEAHKLLREMLEHTTPEKGT